MLPVQNEFLRPSTSGNRPRHPQQLAEVGLGIQRKKNWTREETMELISAYMDPEIQKKFRGCKRSHSHVWEVVAQRVPARKDVTGEECKQRWFHLKQTYAKFARNQNMDNVVPDWEFWSILDHYLGDQSEFVVADTFLEVSFKEGNGPLHIPELPEEDPPCPPLSSSKRPRSESSFEEEVLRFLSEQRIRGLQQDAVMSEMLLVLQSLNQTVQSLAETLKRQPGHKCVPNSIDQSREISDSDVVCLE